jgi:Ras family protein T1
LEGVKEVVRDHDPTGVVDNGLSEAGFLYLHTLFIQRGRLETTWTVLRKFGYGDDLSLRDEFLYPPLEVPQDCSIELSPAGYNFLIDLFQVHDKDKDGTLNDVELDQLFSTTPGNPWRTSNFPSTCVTNDVGSVTLQGFLAQWSMMTLLDHRLTLAYLGYLGFGTDTRPAVKVTKPRKHDRRKQKVQRNVFLCYVIGATGSGKTALVRSLVEKRFDGKYMPTSKPQSAVNSVEIGGAEKYLVMQEFPPTTDQEMLLDQTQLDACDLICYVYDSSDVNSFAYIANLRKRFELDNIPSVFVATKSDLDTVQQRDHQPDQYCRNLGLAVPISVSMKQGISAQLYNLLVGVAMDPSVALPGTRSGPPSQLVKYLTVGAAVSAVVLVVSLIGFRLLRRSRI